MNPVQDKFALRKRLRAEKKAEVPRMACSMPTWGKAAQENAAREFGSPLEQVAHDHLFPPTLAQEVVRLATAEVGVKEHPAGSNRGPRVDQYERVVGGWAVGKAWCADFVTAMYTWAARALKVKVPRFPSDPAGVSYWTEMIRSGRHGWRRVEPAAAMPGDVVTLWGSAHIEVVVSVDVHGHLLHCIGGNTSEAGQNSNGGEVCHTTRAFNEVTVVGRHG